MNELLTKGIGHTEFKDSPVGKIPVGWEVKELVQVGRCIRGLTYSPDNVVENGLLVLRSSNVQDGRLLFEDNVYVDLKVGDEYLSKNGDILICVRNGSRRLLGKSATITSNCPKSTHGAFMTVFRGELNFYVKHLMKSEMFFRQVSIDIGATINSINNSNLLQFRFSFPSLPEQQKIASILTSVDEVIEKTQSQINKLQDLKKGTMNELLTKGIGHTEFKDSPVGKIPKGWEVGRFDELATLQRGFDLPVQERVDGKYKIYGSNGVIGFHDDFKVAGEGVVTGRSGSLGEVWFVGVDFWALNTTLYVKNFHQNHPKFIYYFLIWFDLSRYGTGTGVPTLNRNDVHNVCVAYPPLPEQQKIASILSSMDTHIEEKQRKLEQTQSLKKSLMQDLLTGKVRVTVH